MNDCNGNVRALELRDWRRKWARRLGRLTVIGLAAFAGFRGYDEWRKQNLAGQTAQFAARGDFASAVLVARRLLQLDPDNLAACRAMAQMAETAGSGDALLWRKKIAKLEPASAADRIALIRCALRFGQIDLAVHTLAAWPEGTRGSLEYHELAGAAALAQKNPLVAEEHFAAAVALAPNDSHLAVNLAIVRLASSDPARVNQARASLTALAEQPAARLPSLRALAADALAHADLTNARHWAAALKAEPGANFADALVYFQSFEGTEEAAPALQFLLGKAAAAASTTAELMTWLNRHELAQVAIYWSASLPKQILTTQPVPLALAECYSFVQDWTGLQSWVAGKNWGEYESLRLAVESHALRRLGPADRPSPEAETSWRAALKAAPARPEQLVAIAQLAEGWGYRAEAEEAWWAAANGNDHPRTALAALQRIYKAQQDTRGLLRVARRAMELNPNDLIAANNCASLGLLLSADNTARRLALKLHTEHPGNRTFAATYAFALNSEGKAAEGLRVLETTLSEEQLRIPAIAAYYVVMLVDDEQLDRARAFLVDAKRATLLPEEQKLLSTATRKLVDGDAAVASAL